ncbi:recombinase RdgC [Aggregatibacter actinomycetemcomitans serotype d str. SA3033]|uniref:recombination-associated protein RdgC n=1 Tax=Aggregatibacter actinomycetemcomitans TaxID=714 RepID=UPI00022ABF32|nr:recombination-associated protein RdgC [Aggregatibacter actinomycetemcomitans]KOE66153.1 recombinase RdgC [Aggregatibacter actinomycetemcomitans serotype d str. I63B]KYK83071.1 recombinase RdgC [Aggregatibacter actinomycetemcomitans serotype d str. SA3033]KYK87546.1 recombinase RdgC [Aggregatibacter actinomycetemcomitans serotype d str. SA2200]KYK95181.1 recombinase RdgC [Aggregatibacter actinomycetemcomitans serotype d str. SA3733]
MFWFKNAMIYRLTKSLDWSEQTLSAALTNHQYYPCHQSEQSKFGWSQPLKGSELLYFTVGKQILLLAQKEEKMLPSHVVKRELDARIEKLEQAENRKLKKVEKQTLKDDVVATLLPRAFSKYQQTAIWIDAENALIYVDAASAKRAEEVLALLRKSLGSLPVVPLAFTNEPALIMQTWIAQENTPEWLVPLEEAELRDVQTDGVIRCKQQALDSEEILSLVHSKFVTKLALEWEWEERLSFVLNEDCSLKRLKFADQIREQNDDILKEDFAQRFDADFVLMTGILSKLTENLLYDFGGEKERL